MGFIFSFFDSVVSTCIAGVFWIIVLIIIDSIVYNVRKPVR